MRSPYSRDSRDSAPVLPPPAPPSAFTRHATLPLTTLVQMAASAAVIGPTVAAPPLLERLHLGPAAVGIFVAIVYVGAMFAAQVGAFAVRRMGAIRASQAALACAACGLLLMALPWLPVVAFGALLIGAGYGPITPASSQLLSRTTDPRHYALVFSLKQTGVPLGGVVAGLIVPPLIAFGTAWGGASGGFGSAFGGTPGAAPAAVAALAGLALLCGVAVACAQPLARELDRERDPAARWPTLRQAAEPARFVVAHPVLRTIALCSLVFSTVQVSLVSYTVSWLTRDLQWALAPAGAALAVSQVAGVVGRIGWGVVADRWLGPRRMLLALALAMVGCALAMPLLSARSAGAAVVSLLAVFGATAVGWNGVYLATVARIVPPAHAGMATAGTLFFTFLGVVVGPPLFGAAGSAFGSLGAAFALLSLPLAPAVWALARARWGSG